MSYYTKAPLSLERKEFIMAVSLSTPLASDLKPVLGVRLGTASCAIKRGSKIGQRQDLLLIELSENTVVAGVFTNNRFSAAPVQVCRAHLKSGVATRALVINTGNANAGTGQSGLAHAYQTCQAVAEQLQIKTEAVLPFSTGVILEALPVNQLIEGIPIAYSGLHEDRWLEAAKTIMTTDTLPKAVSRQVTIQGQTVTITGISKGAGMIRPNMATMLGFIATDAKIDQILLTRLLQKAVNISFNRITIDGDTSTNDSLMLVATGQSGATISTRRAEELLIFNQALTEIAQDLAQRIVRDGEGATKFMSIVVENAKTESEAAQIAYAIAHSPLVKTAFFACDPNLGRILAAIGYAGINDLDVNKIRVYLDNVLIAENGGRAATYQEEQGYSILKQSDITIRVVLGRGEAKTTVWTCDLSYDYVRINAEYRS